jgi:hypothetical protein
MKKIILILAVLFAVSCTATKHNCCKTKEKQEKKCCKKDTVKHCDKK